MMYFDPSYFKEEEREGFVIKPMMKRVWAAQLEVLKVIDDICKRHNIMYYAEYGTLLGTIRHKGFIPWDDDMDIGMLRKDYARFCHYAKKELPEDFLFLGLSNRNYDEFIARIVNSQCIKTEPSYLDKFHGCPYIIGVDIFISDNLPLDKGEEELQLQLFEPVFSLARSWNDESVTDQEKEYGLLMIENLCRIKFNRDEEMVPQLCKLADQIAAMYWDVDVKEVSIIPKLLTNAKYRLPVDCFSSVIEMPFDVTTIPVPVGYDQILKIRYGKEYMTPKRYSNHGYPFFKVQQAALFNAYQEKGYPLPEFLTETIMEEEA